MAMMDKCSTDTEFSKKIAIGNWPMVAWKEVRSRAVTKYFNHVG
jgi:hypothetical protein